MEKNAGSKTCKIWFNRTWQRYCILLRNYTFAITTTESGGALLLRCVVHSLHHRLVLQPGVVQTAHNHYFKKTCGVLSWQLLYWIQSLATHIIHTHKLQVSWVQFIFHIFYNVFVGRHSLGDLSMWTRCWPMFKGSWFGGLKLRSSKSCGAGQKHSTNGHMISQHQKT